MSFLKKAGSLLAKAKSNSGGNTFDGLMDMAKGAIKAHIKLTIFFPIIVPVILFILILTILGTTFHVKLNLMQMVDPNSKTESANGSNVSGSVGVLTDKQREDLVAAARSQMGIPYCSMHYSPDGDGCGFGCAMFVSYCYNQVLFGGVRGDFNRWSDPVKGFYGSTWEYWGNVTNDGYDAYNKTFVEVSQEEALPGDVVAYTKGSDPYASHSACGHVGLYIGDNTIIDANIPVVGERPVDYTTSSDYHFLRFTGTPE